jgi:hypothetical protein
MPACDEFVQPGTDRVGLAADGRSELATVDGAGSGGRDGERNPGRERGGGESPGGGELLQPGDVRGDVQVVSCR